MMVLKEWWRILFKPKNDSYRIARKALLGNVSYLFPESDRGNPLLGFVEIKSIWNKAYSALPSVFGESDQVVFDRSPSYAEYRIEYLKAQDIEVKGFISKSSLIEYRHTLALRTRIRIYAIAFVIAFRILIHPKSSVNLALLIRSLFETHILVKLLPETFNGSIHDFVQYDTDSNAIYLVLKRAIKGNYSHLKYPSPGPLMAHNQLLLSDVLCVNHPYHIEEVKAFGDDVITSKIDRVPPEGFFKYAEYYQMEKVKSDCDLGYYSHGGWVRTAEGHANDGLNIAQTEVKLLLALSSFIKENQDTTLTIFLHPKEKQPHLENKTAEFYRQFFSSGMELNFAEKPSTECFDTVRFGVGVYSTILFERLICGFPTLIMSPVSGFPLRGSSLESISINEKNLGTQVLRMLELGRVEFYKKHHLEDYLEERIPFSKKLRSTSNNVNT